jgi:hypothetical protein
VSLDDAVRDTGGGECAKVSRRVAILLKPDSALAVVAVLADGAKQSESL